jgi:ABC-type uncharacterized transport system permease subunit
LWTTETKIRIAPITTTLIETIATIIVPLIEGTKLTIKTLIVEILLPITPNSIVTLVGSRPHLKVRIVERILERLTSSAETPTTINLLSWRRKASGLIHVNVTSTITLPL